MKCNLNLLFVAALISGMLLATSAQAALDSRLGGAAAYDDVLDITWLTNANALGSGTWQDQVDAAAALDTLGFDDWRLASISVSAGLPTGTTTSVVSCDGSNEVACRDNELAYMYVHNMDGSGNNTGTQVVDGISLTDVQSFYWSGTEVVSSDAWGFAFDVGGRFSNFKLIDNYSGWAVRSGDVDVVPLPAAVWLFGSSLLALIGIGRHRRR